jgi:Cu/Ag efflux pump CusA
MGIAIIGGLLVSLGLTLFVVPCMYALVEGLAERRAEKLSSRETP